MIKKLFTILFGLFVLTSLSHAETYKIYMGVPAGSLSDNYTRKMAQLLEKETGDNFVVINKPGADQLVGYREFLAESKTNPNVIYHSGTGTHVTSYVLYPDLKLDPLADTKSLFVLSRVHYMVCAPKDSTITGLNDIKGKLNIGSSNATSAMIIRLSNFDPEVQMIPFKDDQEVFVNLLSKTIPVAMCVSINPMIKAHKDTVKVVANFDHLLIGAVGYHVPKDFSEDKAKRINAAMNKAIQDPEYRAWLIDNTGTPIGGGPENYDRILSTFKRNLYSKLK